MAQPALYGCDCPGMMMDFIEIWLGLSPDNGDGSLEALWVGALVVAVLVVAFRHWIAARFHRCH